jgi:hypothetical protein
MFRFAGDDEKKAKTSVLDEIMEMMENRGGEKLKKPVVAEMSVAEAAPEAEGEEIEEGDEEAEGMSADELTQEELSEDSSSPEEGLSEHDKAMIAALYDRFVR